MGELKNRVAPFFRTAARYPDCTLYPAAKFTPSLASYDGGQFSSSRKSSIRLIASKAKTTPPDLITRGKFPGAGSGSWFRNFTATI